MSNGVPPLGYAFWQSLGPALLLSSIGCWSKNNPLLQLSHWPFFIFCGLIGIAIPNTNMYFVANHIPAGLLAVIVNIVPLLVYPLAIIFRQEQFDPLRLFALLIGTIGIMGIIGVTTWGDISKWTLIALISPLGFASCSIYICAKKPLHLSALQAARGMLLAASFILLPLVISQQAYYSLLGPLTLVKKVILLEIILSSVGYLLFFNLIRLAGPVYYSLTGGIVSITGLFWGYVAYGEVPTLDQSVAALLVISSVFLLSWRQSQVSKGN